MKAVQDFNYKVALAQGLKHLQAKKLRQAEEQFRYLVQKFPQADGGYRGLARVHIELGDRSAALGTLRDGAAALSRAGERAVAIDLLREAIAMDPLDLSAHRRLASSFALGGDVAAAAEEYVRFANAEIAAGDPDRAKLEASYALETLGEIPALHELARTVGLQLRTVRRLAPEPEAVARDLGPAVEPTIEPITEAAAAEPVWSPPEPTAAATSWELPPPITEIPPPPPPEATRADPLELEERAMEMIARRDPDAGRVGVEAARALTEAGKVDAASDLLLSLVASGLEVREAERALIAVAQRLGRNEIAAERERLLETVGALG